MHVKIDIPPVQIKGNKIATDKRCNNGEELGHDGFKQECEKCSTQTKTYQYGRLKRYCAENGSMERKLERHNIHSRTTNPVKLLGTLLGKVCWNKDTSLNFTAEEMKRLSIEQLSELKRSLHDMIARKRAELQKEENVRKLERMYQETLRFKTRYLENNARANLRPFINSVPQSEEMARVLMLS